jgi:hypothetical protein
MVHYAMHVVFYSIMNVFAVNFILRFFSYLSMFLHVIQ